MYHRMPVAAVVGLLGAALSVSPSPLTRPAHAAEAAKVSVAVVNMQRVMSEAKPVAALDAEFQSTLKSQQKQLDHMFAGRLLDDKERAELETLQKLASPNASQSKRIQELSKLSDDRQTEMERLSRVQQPTAADRTRMTQLQGYLDKQNQRVMQLQQSLGKARNDKQQEVLNRAMQTISSTVQAIANERGIELVVDKNSVLFSRATNEITDEVLRRLNGVAAAPAKK